jgi:hypothetical protein
MTVRDAEGRESTPDAEERRTGTGQRLAFEALVAVGEGRGGAGFEAESIDVSPKGMRLRTAYLPEVGERLVCRFEGAGTEVIADGEVVWRKELGRGGEFGLRFSSMEGDAADRLRAFCAPREDDGAAVAAPGARVRLHIEGLGSPMKARVRDASTGEVRVGSNLEFLRVGRALEVEDVDRAAKQSATIEHVTVEIDPATQVPQLVVALRYPQKAGAAAATTVASAAAASAAKEPTPAPPSAPRGEAASADVDVEDAGEGGDESEVEAASEHEPKLAGAKEKAGKVAQAGLSAAKKVGPALAGAGAKAKGAVASALAYVSKRRAERAEAKKADAPRRTTSPAPGSLKAEGRRLVRDEGGVDAKPVLARRSPKRAAVLGGIAGVLVVAGVIAGLRLLGAHKEVASDAAPPEAQPVAALPAAAALHGAAQGALAPNNGSGPAVGSVPLFGATPLSTTEVVPPPPDPAAAPIAAAPGAGDDPGAGNDDEGDGDEGAPVTEWGQGVVKSPIVLRLKMDDAIESLNGAKGAMGFTISLPGRRSLSAASDLAKKDKRIASLDVVNNAYGSEVTVQFKDGVPPYLAKAKGNRLEIAIGSEGKSKGGEKAEKKVAQKKSGGDRHDKHDKKKAAAKGADKGGKKAKDAAKKPAKGKEHKEH